MSRVEPAWASLANRDLAVVHVRRFYLGLRLQKFSIFTILLGQMHIFWL